MPLANAKHSGPIRFAALAMMLQAASEPVRAGTLLLLGDGERDVGAIVEAIGCSTGVLSGHLLMLRQVGLVEARRDGQRRIYRLTDAGREMATAVATLARLSL